MKELSKKELLEVEGGTSINSTLLTALVKGATIFLELGRSLGSAIRRTFNKKSCSI